MRQAAAAAAKPCVLHLLLPGLQFTLSQYAAADLGMAAREAGYKVLLQPLAIAQREDQMEGAADPATHQATEAQNMIRLKAKWRQRLQV